MLGAAKSFVKNLLNRYPSWLCRQEYESQRFTRFNERPVEFGFVFRKIGEIYPKKVLDVGTGTTALPHLMSNCGCLVTAVDNVRDYWPAGMLNRHYHVIDDDITKTHLQETFDFITCISVLEHIHDFNAAVRSMFALLNPNGHLVLSFPYNESGYVKNVFQLPGSSYGQHLPYITQSFSRNEIDNWVREHGAAVIDQEYWRFWDGDHWTVGNQVIPPKKVRSDERHQLACILLQKKAE